MQKPDVDRLVSGTQGSPPKWGIGVRRELRCGRGVKVQAEPSGTLDVV
jgi:hypothetical protein